MRKPDPVEVAAAAMPVFIAEAVVAVVMFLGAAIFIQGHTLWAAIIGLPV